jgi:large subunit ribosomal protein L23
MSVLDIILTEKSVRLAEGGQFTFKVAKTATCKEIAQQIEKLYDVHVVSVNSSLMPAKTRGRGKYLGKKSGYKKAYVRLKPGEKIEAFVIETEKEKKEKDKKAKEEVRIKKEEKSKHKEIKQERTSK